MAETPTNRLWTGRAIYAGIACVLIFVHLLPLAMVPRVWAWPDLLLCVTFAWAARRPDYVPALLIALVFLTADLLFQRPLGLMTALVLLLTEALRTRAAGLRNAPFILEWTTVAVAIVAVTLGNRLILAVVMSPQAPLALTLIQMLMTILAYPLVAFASYVLFGVSRPAPGAVDTLGHRL